MRHRPQRARRFSSKRAVTSAAIAIYTWRRNVFKGLIGTTIIYAAQLGMVLPPHRSRSPLHSHSLHTGPLCQLLHSRNRNASLHARPRSNNLFYYAILHIRLLASVVSVALRSDLASAVRPCPPHPTCAAMARVYSLRSVVPLAPSQVMYH